MLESNVCLLWERLLFSDPFIHSYFLLTATFSLYNYIIDFLLWPCHNYYSYKRNKQFVLYLPTGKQQVNAALN